MEHLADLTPVKPFMYVSEIFHSVQGEGPSTGRPASFLRLAACNLKCSWCDTKYTWDWQGEFGVKYDPKVEAKGMSHKEIFDALYVDDVRGSSLLVITGGEPLLQQRAIMSLPLSHWERVEFETNGTILPDKGLMRLPNVHFNVSPKLDNSSQDYHVRIKGPVLREYGQHPRTVFKFVCEGEQDLKEVENLAREFNLPNNKIWIMPQATTKEGLDECLSQLVEQVRERRWILTTRLHIQLWKGARGL